ncbi:hypothetical protein, partial [Flavobacterium akiainvivens]|uniref:hypothetical protein n=1 Tax=Flavobacterium akiainvivens TaxID=1202724 RepID=UPI001C42EDF9
KMYCFLFAHICQLANAGRRLFENRSNTLKSLFYKGFSHCKKNQKSAKPMGKHWQTNTTTLLNFVL